MREKILLAGCGDLGQRLAEQLWRRGAEVWALRRRPPAGPSPIHWLAGDLARPQGIGELPAGLTGVVYAAAPDRRDEAAYRAIFLDGPRHLLRRLDDAALRRFVLVSSSAVYGEHAGAWIDESTEPRPLGFRGGILLQAERQLAAGRLPLTILRLAGLYGPGRLRLLDRLRAGVARAPRRPPHWTNHMHIEDAAAALAHLLALPQAAPLYLGADDTPLPQDQLYRDLAALIGAPPPAEGPPPEDIGSKRLCNRLLRESGFALRWPDPRAGYAASLNAGG